MVMIHCPISVLSLAVSRISTLIWATIPRLCSDTALLSVPHCWPCHPSEFLRAETLCQGQSALCGRWAAPQHGQCRGAAPAAALAHTHWPLCRKRLLQPQHSCRNELELLQLLSHFSAASPVCSRVLPVLGITEHPQCFPCGHKETSKGRSKWGSRSIMLSQLFSRE